MSQIYTEIGKLIKEYRLRHTSPMSQESLAQSVGLSRTSIVNIEQGKHKIQLHKLYEIAKALEIEIGKLLPKVSHEMNVRIISVENLNKKMEKKIKDIIQQKESKEVKLIGK